MDYLAELDRFIEDVIAPLQAQDDNERFFDHRREHARTDWDNQGLPRKEWEELLAKARKLADEAGHLRYAWPPEMGGKGGSQLAMAVIREHLAAKGLGLFNDLADRALDRRQQPLHPDVQGVRHQRPVRARRRQAAERGMRTGFGLTEPNHGSDATFMETRGVRHEKDGKPGWLINGEKCGRRECTSPRMSWFLLGLPGKMGTPLASPASSFRPTRPA